ncbi:hypothetical protein NL504_28320, partial [Klebsiella pneumoniae]|nr:hypothetical protein [Klebsiella pneumoniae]
DQLTFDGRTYAMKQHGIARGSVFDLVSADGSQCLFRLAANERTREAYPFDFVLEIVYRLEGPRLAVSARVANAGTGDMPVSF